MQSQVTSDNIKLSLSMVGLAEEKLAKLENHLSDVPEDQKGIRIVFNTGPDETFLVKVELSVFGKTYFGDDSSFSLENALINALAEVDRQYKKRKTKQIEERWEEKRESKRFPLDVVEGA